MNGAQAVAAILVSLAAGAFLGVARSDSDAGRDLRLRATNLLGPVADLLALHRDQTFYKHDPVTGDPTSVLDRLSGGAKGDPDFLACLRASGADPLQTIRDLAEFHAHRATAQFATCLLTRNKGRFCTSEGRQQAADILEFYFWSRDNGRSPAHDRLAAARRAEAQANAPFGAAPDVDPFEKSWDGPEDRDVIDQFRNLISAGYLDADAFGQFPRSEIRDALNDVKTRGSACPGAQAPG